MGWKGECMIEYSLGIIIGYAIAKALTPYAPKLLTDNYHIHHWMWATMLLPLVFLINLQSEIVVGIITGIALEGLSYNNWTLKRKKSSVKCRKPKSHLPQFEGKINCQHCKRELK